MDTGIYIHVPFCRSKCHYCNFVSQTWDDGLARRYGAALLREMEARAPQGEGDAGTVDAIFLGGGTPSLLSSGQVEAILDTCRRLYDVMPGSEITLEANPGTLEAGKLESWKGAGVNRISLGVQSFSDRELAAAGRIHRSREIEEGWRLLRSCGFENISLDLILGLPDQGEEDWRRTLDRAVALRPEHLSVYMLELDPRVPMQRMIREGRAMVPGEDETADRYLHTLDFLADSGYPQYEISNFSRPGCECRHNLKYWLRQPVLGFGPAAHSHDGIARSANFSRLPEYLQAVEEGRSPMAFREAGYEQRNLEEEIFLGLRLRRGIDWESILQRCRPERRSEWDAALFELENMGLLERAGAAVRLTRKGMLLANEVFQRFVTDGPGA